MSRVLAVSIYGKLLAVLMRATVSKEPTTVFSVVIYFQGRQTPLASGYGDELHSVRLPSPAHTRTCATPRCRRWTDPCLRRRKVTRRSDRKQLHVSNAAC